MELLGKLWPSVPARGNPPLALLRNLEGKQRSEQRHGSLKFHIGSGLGGADGVERWDMGR